MTAAHWPLAAHGGQLHRVGVAHPASTLQAEFLFLGRGQVGKESTECRPRVAREGRRRVGERVQVGA